MSTIIDARVSPRMRQFLLANKKNRLHPDQLREVVLEPFVSLLVLILVPAIILLRSMLFTLFVGGLWMVGTVGIVYGLFRLYQRWLRYRRIKIFYAICHSGAQLPPRWQFWKPFSLITQSGSVMRFKRSLAADKKLQIDQYYLVYYYKEHNHAVLLSFAPLDHPEIDLWKV
ncbi:MAG: hypothetical protein LCI00_30475 [Chloroflexi bacterium]|nr:hypothetical protein [Chloroflexota bacterium]MCC6894719.1 hypothetical protein [Anaerolineae bacterium]